MEEKKGLVFDIQSYSVHDGPGCRTTCFMAGCFLKCAWCANPESWVSKQKIMFAESKCKHNQGCLRCMEVCPHKSVSFDENNKLAVNWEVCRECNDFECAKACYNEAKDFNDTEENIQAIADFMEKLEIFEINLLPFHRMGDSKWNQLGKKYAYSEDESTSEEKMNKK